MKHKRTKNSAGQWFTLACKWLGDVVALEKETGVTLEQCLRRYAKYEGAKVVRVVRSRKYVIAEFCHA